MPHRRLVSVLALALAALTVALAAASASAAPVRECGTYDLNTMRWTFRPSRGAVNVANLTTRNVSCTTARRFARRYRGTDTYFPTWRCREVQEYESFDVRCTASRGRVIRWQGGS
jgi:hypothetical protein